MQNDLISGKNNVIEDFDEAPYTFLSNFSQHGATFEGVYYITSEHAYQAAKTLDMNERRQIQICGTPGAAKKMGQKITIRPDWDQIKVSVMYQILKSKFGNDIMRSKLLSTGDAELIEGNTWNDTFWGICNGVGQNWLGRLLMLVRSDLQYEYRNYNKNENNGKIVSLQGVATGTGGFFK